MFLYTQIEIIYESLIEAVVYDFNDQIKRLNLSRNLYDLSSRDPTDQHT